jgi:hypothetical protein
MLEKFKSLSQNVASKAASKAAQGVSAARSGAVKGVEKAKNRKKGSGEQHIVALDIGTEFVKALVGRVQGDEVQENQDRYRSYRSGKKRIPQRVIDLLVHD